MKLHEITPTVQAIITSVAELVDIPQITDINQKKDLETALQESGLALVFIQDSGDPIDKSAPDLLLSNMLIVSVLENPKTNETGMNALEVVGRVLKAVHGYDWGSTGLKNALTVDSPAYTRGELDSGLTTYFCNFQIKTIE